MYILIKKVCYIIYILSQEWILRYKYLALKDNLLESHFVLVFTMFHHINKEMSRQ